jgi:hypothetical protein
MEGCGTAMSIEISQILYTYVVTTWHLMPPARYPITRSCPCAVLSTTSWRLTREYMYGLHTLNLDITWRWVVDFTHQTIYRWENIPKYPLDDRHCVPKRRSGLVEKRKGPGIWPSSQQPDVFSQLIAVNTLHITDVWVSIAWECSYTPGNRRILPASSQVGSGVDSSTPNRIILGNYCDEWILEVLTMIHIFIIM